MRLDIRTLLSSIMLSEYDDPVLLREDETEEVDIRGMI